MDREPSFEGDEIPRPHEQREEKWDADERDEQTEAEQKPSYQYRKIEQAERENKKQIEQVAIRLSLNDDVQGSANERPS